MRPKFLIFLTLVFFPRLLLAGDVITFSPELPKSWVTKTRQAVPATDPISNIPFTIHLLVIQNTNTSQTMMISVMPILKSDAKSNFEQDARNWVAGMVDGIRGQNQSKVSDLKFKTVKSHKTAETTFTISSLSSGSDLMHGISRYWISTTNAVGLAALSPDPSVETDKTVLSIAASIQIEK